MNVNLGKRFGIGDVAPHFSSVEERPLVPLAAVSP